MSNNALHHRLNDIRTDMNHRFDAQDKRLDRITRNDVRTRHHRTATSDRRHTLSLAQACPTDLRNRRTQPEPQAEQTANV